MLVSYEYSNSIYLSPYTYHSSNNVVSYFCNECLIGNLITAVSNSYLQKCLYPFIHGANQESKQIQ